MSATDLLRDYWYLMPVAVALDALVLGGMSYGVWRGIRRYVTGRRKPEHAMMLYHADGTPYMDVRDYFAQRGDPPRLRYGDSEE